MATKEETVEKAKENVRKSGASIAGTIFDDKDFQQKVNGWMIQQHVLWGIQLAILFIGLNYGVIWFTNAFTIPPWAIAVVATPIGGGATVYQWLKWRRPNGEKKHEKIITE